MPEVEVNGVGLVYAVTGDGPPVLMVCGTGQASPSWEAFGLIQPIIGAGCTAITFDNRGVPPSSCPTPPWTVEDMAADAIGLMEHLGLGPYHVLGASLGGLITQTIALRRPDLVRSVMLVVGAGNFCTAARLALEGQVALLSAGVELPAALQQWMLLEAVTTATQRQDDDIVSFVVAMAGGLIEALGPGGQLGQFSADATWAGEDHLPELAGLSVPALILSAEHDCYFSPANMAAAAELIPDAVLVTIPGAPHVFLEPAQVALAADAIAAHLARCA